MRPPLDRRLLGRALTELANAGVAQVLAQSPTPQSDAPGARRIGLTGAPGAGKSTLAGHLGLHRAKRGSARVAVLAIDPTSPRSHGAILGDRIRMDELEGSEDLFIRSFASRSASDGLTDNLPELLDVMDRFGFDEVLLETVGVGQAEYAARSQVDSLVLVLPPDGGDAVQAMKAGIMEVADIFAVNKADMPQARRFAAEVRRMAAMARGATDRWRAPVLLTSAQDPPSVAALSDALDRHFEWLETTGRRDRNRLDRSKYRLRRWLERRIDDAIERQPASFFDMPAPQQVAGVLLHEAHDDLPAQRPALSALLTRPQQSRPHPAKHPANRSTHMNALTTPPLTQRQLPDVLVSEELARFSTELRFEDIPERVLEKAKLHMLDALGVALASSTEDFAPRIVNALTGIGGEGAYPVIGFPNRLPIRDAVLANGALVHGIDFDDTHSAGIIHVSSSALPMALAGAQSIEGGGKDTLLAYLICVETSSRIAIAAKGGFHVNGFHPTGMVAAFGAALGLGRLWGLTHKQLAHAQGIVLSMASGSFEFLEDGAWNKRLHPGWAVGAAMTACALAKGGFVGAKRPYEGRYGLYNSYLGKPDAADLSACTAGLGTEWEMLNVALKPYPVCHYNHAFVDAALKLRQAHAIDPVDIESINALIGKDQIGIVCEPEANKRRPQNSYDARFSLHFAIAAALVYGRLTMDEIQSEAINDPRVLALCDKARYAIDPDSAYPRHYSGALEIRMKNGRTLRHREPINRGSRENPLSASDTIEKFRRTASRALPAAGVEQVVAATLSIESAASAGHFANALGAPRLDR